MAEDVRALALRLYALANEGRWDDWMGAFHPDGVLEEALLLDRTTYEGHAGLQEWLTVSAGALVAPHFDVEEMEDVGDGLLVRYALTARGTTSGVPITQRVFHAIRARDGLVSYVGAFADEASARSELASSSSGKDPSSTA
jgi:hypothetical protein